MADPHNGAISVRQAQERILSNVRVLQSEQVPIEDCLGRVVGEPLVAKLTQPPFSASAMDGYAVRSVDVAKTPCRLSVVGESAAGHGYTGAIGSGEAVRIFTGAPVPDGADAIVIQENVTVGDGGLVDVVTGVSVPSHIRAFGGDFKKGDVLIEPGEVLSSRHVTLAAAMGFGTLAVRRQPVVAILATGDELVPAGTMPGLDEIVASNEFGIAGIVHAVGGLARRLGIASDTRISLRDKIAEAAGADVLVTIGGASVGDHDLVGPALLDAGMVLDFWKIAMRPGKPLLFGQLGKQHVIGVPGNPVSSLICARVFLVPLLRALLGLTPAIDFGLRSAQLLQPIPANGPREHFMRGILERNDSRGTTVKPMRDQDSSLMVPMVRSNCLIVRPAGALAVGIGENVTVMRLDF